MPELVPEDDGRSPSPEVLAEASAVVHAELNDKLINVINEIAEIADNDCYGDYRSDSDPKKECDCHSCCAKRAVHALNRIRLPVVRSLHPNRLQGDSGERVYFEHWLKENTRVPGLNGGWGLLELVVSTEKREGWSLTRPPAYISQRDMDVATAVVQWLGTNCGQCFIAECERLIKQGQKLRAHFERVTHVHNWKDYPEKSIFNRIAEKIANETFPDPKDAELHSLLVNKIARAMLYATAKGEFEEVQ